LNIDTPKLEAKQKETGVQDNYKKRRLNVNPLGHKKKRKTWRNTPQVIKSVRMFLNIVNMNYLMGVLKDCDVEECFKYEDIGLPFEMPNRPNKIKGW